MSQFPGVMSPETLDALDQSLAELGLVNPRLRCCMPEFAVNGLSRWSSPDVKYTHQLSLPGVTANEVIQAYRQACDEWNRVCGIRLQPAIGEPFGSGNINAKSGRIDGGSGTLAWSFLPGTPSGPNESVEQLFDHSENWTYAWLVEVICHEVGHAIGLGHSNDKLALMYPYSHSGTIPKPQPWDIGEALKRYPKTEAPRNQATISGVIVVNGVSYGFTGTQQ